MRQETTQNDGPLRGRLGRAVAVIASLAALGCVDGLAATAGRAASEGGAPQSAWEMHPIDQQYRGANSLGRGDVNGDGLADYSVNYEFDQRYVVYLHPAAGVDPRLPWPRVVLTPNRVVSGQGGVASESSALADLDGDGNVDLVGAQSGDSLAVIGYEPGIPVWWGPDAALALDPTAWIDAGRIPATIDAGHYHWIVARDVDEDGDTDLMVGGRVLIGTKDPTGILWIEAPDEPASRRDLSQWVVHEIDTDTWSGHGFAFSDVDEDGDDDLVDATADFDTPPEAEDVAWYENPGPGTAAQRQPWKRTVLYASPDFTLKPQIGVGDLDGDGLEDLVTQTPEDLIVFRKTAVDPVTFETIVVRKPYEARWTPRTVRVADLDGDGRNEVVGMLSHEQSAVPVDKASVFRVIPPRRLGARGWETRVVAWGPGTVMQASQLGSKWDQADITDVDGDGDLDIVANNEEWWTNAIGELGSFADPGNAPTSVPVVWFENRLDEQSRGCRERRGACAFEAERPTRILDGTWVEHARDDASSGAVLEAFNGLDPLVECRRPASDCPRLGPDNELPRSMSKGVEYDSRLRGGRYSVWMRVRVPTQFGTGLGDDRSDSVWVLVDGRPQVLQLERAPRDEWSWVEVGRARRFEPGRHTIRLQVRERGLAVDQVVLTTDDGPPPES